jgi:non-ribosomal peptide synthase protein (TIGR01720 family)
MPIPDLQVHLLDAAGRPAPLGVPGEIHVGGAGVARGYLGRPALTAERFVPDPFSGRAGARLYRSGDLARYRPTADLEYLGRTDHQVKVRGFRIELGEIEAVLASHPGLREAVVLARPSAVDPAGAADAVLAADAGNAPAVAAAPGAPAAAGERRLVAYFVAGPGAPSPAELRAFARERLPEYLVPAVFVPLPALPLTAHGKVDRAALPDPGRDRPGRMEEGAAPRTPAEELLAGIWAEVLGCERVGVDDNFFDLGGDSILSIQIVARARRQGLHLEPRHLFEHQTVAELAAVAVPAAAMPAAAAQGPVTGPLPLTPIQAWFLATAPADPHQWNQSLLLATREPLGPAALARLARVAARLLAHHDALRLRLRRFPGAPGNSGARGDDQQWVAAPLDGPRSFSAVDLATLPAAARRAAVESCAAAVQASLDLAGGPIARFVAFALGAEQPGRLLIVVHHWAIDGVSWRILLEDLASAYEQTGRGDGVEIALPPKTTSYRDWALRLQERARAESLERELAHWRELARAAALPRLAPAGDGGGTVAAARAVDLSLTAEETRALLREVPAIYRTRIDEVLLAALARAVASRTGGRGLLVDLEGHGREDAGAGLDLSRTVGWFTALYPVALQLADPADPGGCLREVKELLRRVPERGVGYGLLRYLRGGAPAAELAALPQAEIAFNYLGQLDQALPAAAPFAAAAESRGAERSPRGRRPHLVEIGCSVAFGVFRSTWTYDSVRLAEAEVRLLADAFLAALRDTVEHCRSRQGIEYTPADFPEAALSEQLLARALAEIEQE